MFLQVCVILFTGGGVPDQVHPPPGPGALPRTRYTPPEPGTPPRPGTPPWDQVHPPRPGTPPDQVHPPGPGTHPPGTRYTPQPGTPPLDQVHPPGTRELRRYGLRAGGTHPTGMHSCLYCFRNFLCLVIDVALYSSKNKIQVEERKRIRLVQMTTTGMCTSK